eukprot:m.1113672 g.1113672  ORF g.1113672 m.1113672 type:complete len:86 (-) comp24363_c0_seq43:2894-3151(-)
MVKEVDCGAPVTAVSFMDDGVTVAIGTSDGSVRVLCRAPEADGCIYALAAGCRAGRCRNDADPQPASQALLKCSICALDSTRGRR